MTNSLNNADNAGTNPPVAKRDRDGALAFVAEAVLVFGALVVAERLAFAPGAFAAMQPSPWWIAVILLAVQRGLVGGVLAAAIASALYVSAGLPERALTDSVAAYRADILAQPLAWLVAGTLIGMLRSRQAALARTDREALAAATAQLGTLSDGIESLLQRNRALERRIAADAASLGASLARWSLPDDADNRRLLDDATPFLAAAAQADGLGVFECEAGQFHHVAGAGPSRLVHPEALFAPTAPDQAGRPWGVRLFARDGETVVGAVIVYDLREGVDPAFARDCLIRAADALQRQLAPAGGERGLGRAVGQLESVRA